LENLEAMGEMITQAQCTLEAMLELSNIDFKSFEFLNQISSTPLESDS